MNFYALILSYMRIWILEFHKILHSSEKDSSFVSMVGFSVTKICCWSVNGAEVNES